MHNLDLIFTLTGGLAVALVFGYLTDRAGLSPIVGYVLAGIAVGPHTPGFEADPQLAEQLAEVGVILLMFGVGLQFHLDELLAVRRVAIPGAIAQSAVATVLGVLAARWFGWDWSAGIIFGLAISVASTVVMVRVLADNRDLHTPAGRIAVGWLVVEDLFTVVVLVLLPALVGGGAGAGQLAAALAGATFKVSILVAFAFLVGGRVIPWLLAQIAHTRSRELFTLTVLVVALGIAVGSARVFDVSMALGAFLAGMVVGRSEFSFRAASEALPMRDAFAVLFFVSVGMLLEPSVFLTSPLPIVATLAIILIGKPLAAFAAVRALEHSRKTGLVVGVSLAQIGEFSFILTALGRELGALSSDVVNTVIAAAIISIALNPLLYRAVDPLENWLARLSRARRMHKRRTQPAEVRGESPQPAEEAVPAQHRAVVVGYGPVGRTVTRLLRENDVEPTVVDLNLEVVQRLRRQGHPAVYGDAAQRETLAGAGVASAGSLILSASGLAHSAEIIRMARELNPEIRVLARSNYVAEIPTLRRAGADAVFSGEGEVALAFTVATLSDLGATPEQIDRERERVHEELIARPNQGARDVERGQETERRKGADRRQEPQPRPDATTPQGGEVKGAEPPAAKPAASDDATGGPPPDPNVGGDLRQNPETSA
jgi:CPA2 family monovalent cation:H+ antiporter-2